VPKVETGHTAAITSASANDEEELISGSMAGAMATRGVSSIDLTQTSSRLQIPAKLEQLRQSECSISECKLVLQQGRDDIYRCYEEGVSSAALVSLQTLLTDTILLAWWETVFEAEEVTDMALLAVGGYGRAELHPYSDVDIAILVTRAPDDTVAEKISTFITRLWDIGFDIGHSVRTVEQASQTAAEDVTIITNLMESRLMTGSVSLYTELQRVISPKNMWPSADFFQEKLREQKVRRKKFHNNTYRLEPNLKESSGGLRDIQTVFWICQRQFGTKEFEELVSEEILTPAEFETFIEGLDLLWRIRYACFSIISGIWHMPGVSATTRTIAALNN